jgi:transposase
MAHIKGTPREQIILFPDVIDDYIEEDNTARFIDAFVDSLDMVTLGFKYSATEKTGRPPYNPKDMLKLYIYGYLNRVRSSRRLEKETQRNVEVMWLVKKLTPDFKTIADFRAGNTAAIRSVFKEFTVVCKRLDLFGRELVAIDGSKFRASNAKKKSFTKKKLEKTIKEIEDKIDTYMDELDENDKEEAHSPKAGAKELKEKIDALKTRKGTYQGLLEEMQETGTSEISLTDPDARSMMNNQRVEPCYNIQATVDPKHALIVDFEATNEAADQHRLSTMATRAKEVLEVDQLEVTADKGYYDGQEIKATIDAGVILFIPKPARKRPKEDDLFCKEKFTYDKARDIYICPAKQELLFMKEVSKLGKKIRLYEGQSCSNCGLKEKCTKAAKRTVTRWEHEEILEEMQGRVLLNLDKVRIRQWLSEHPFGTLKRGFDQGFMLLRGLKKVNAEAGLSFLAYNIRRVINIIGIKNLIAAVT